MLRIAVELPEELRDFIATKVQRGDFASASEYIVALVASARRTKSEVVAAPIEGLESGPAEEWADIRQRIKQRRSGD